MYVCMCFRLRLTKSYIFRGFQCCLLHCKILFLLREKFPDVVSNKVVIVEP